MPRNIFTAPQKIRPHFAEAFRCIGPACEDTCCQGWNVLIDKDTYAKYQTIPQGPLRILVEQRLVLTGGGAGDLDYAKVQLNHEGVCSFLAPDRLCAIQKEHGEDYLSVTCANYPRVAKTIDYEQEKTLLLSCPEAARLVLLNPALIPADEGAPRGGSRYRDFLRLAAKKASPVTTPLAYFWQVRHFIVLLLQDRAYPLWQRLFLLGIFCRQLEGLTSKGENGRIPGLLKEYAEMISTGKLRAAMDGIPARPSLQLGVVMTLLEQRMHSGKKNQRLLECIQDFALGIQYQPGRTADDLAGNYIAAYTSWYHPWIEQHPFILENYLLNYVFGHLFPFSYSGPEQGLRAHHEYLLMCFHYGLIKGLLIGMAGHYQSSFDAGHAVKLIQSFVKAVEHNASHIQQIARFFEVNGLNNTNGIAALLRDGAPVEPA